MPSDLQAIDTLSERFTEAVWSRKSQIGERAIVLNRKDPLLDQGLKVLRLYEAELAKDPNDENVKASLAEHLHRMGGLYYMAITPRSLPINIGMGDKFSAYMREGKKEFWQDSDSKTLKELGKEAVYNANTACFYFGQSYNYMPSAEAAYQLGETFRMGQFYRTALYWYDLAEQLSTAFEDEDAAKNARAEKISLQGEDRTQDPPLYKGRGFPKPETPGYLPVSTSQPVMPSMETLICPFKKSLNVPWLWVVIGIVLLSPLLPFIAPVAIIGCLGWLGYKHVVKNQVKTA